MSEKNKEIVRTINEAFSAGNTDGFLEHCADNVVWNMVGEKETRGKTAIKKWMSQMEGAEPPNFTVDALFGDGDHVACHGQMTMKNAEGKEGKYSYCDVYTFAKDKVKELRSFVVAHKPEEKNVSASA